MPFRPHIIDMLETGLSECFRYHNALDNFVLHAGLAPANLTAARERAEQRSQTSGRFQKAPKRYVAQELLRDLGKGIGRHGKLTPKRQ